MKVLNLISKKHIMKKYLGIILGILAIGLNVLFGFFPSLADALYFNVIFQGIRVIYDYTFGWLPFPSVYILYLVFIYFIAQFLLQVYQVFKLQDWLAMLKKLMLNVLSFSGMVIFLFYFLWGFNYKLPSVESRLGIPHVAVDTMALYRETVDILHLIEKTRLQVTQDSTVSMLESFLDDDFEDEIRSQLVPLLREWDYPAHGRVRVRRLRPKGSLLRISTAGVYIPFVCEGHIDAGLHPLQWPFTMAHEMSHGYGFADEGTCNFIGFLACMRSDDSYIQYSGLMGYWRYLASNLRRAAPSKYRRLTKMVTPMIRKDLNEVIEYLDRYPDILPDVRDRIYESYLKSHGIHGGLANYSTIVRLVMGWRETELNRPIFNKLYTDAQAIPDIQ